MLWQQENALGPSAAIITSIRREGCPLWFLAPGFQVRRGHLAACRQDEGRSEELAPLLGPFPPTPASQCAALGNSCTPANLPSWAPRQALSQ